MRCLLILAISGCLFVGTSTALAQSSSSYPPAQPTRSPRDFYGMPSEYSPYTPGSTPAPSYNTRPTSRPPVFIAPQAHRYGSLAASTKRLDPDFRSPFVAPMPTEVQDWRVRGYPYGSGRLAPPANPSFQSAPGADNLGGAGGYRGLPGDTIPLWR